MNERSEAILPLEPRRWAQCVPAVVLILGVTAVVYATIQGYGLMGYDSYPLILTGRIESLSDFWGTFTEELMDGRYPGDYHRPLLNLSFAADYLLWGVQPWGYQLTGALLFGATGFALWRLALRLFGGRTGVGALVALLFFLLHDSQFEVIPVPARRPELLCALFVCVSLWVQLQPRQLECRWPILPAVFMLGAAASKETGYIMPAIACLAVFLYSPATAVGTKFRHALRAAVCHGVLLAGLLGLRFAALGGFGGPAPLPPGFEGPGALQLTGTLFTRLLTPQNFAELRGPLAFLALLTILGIFEACVFRSRGAGRSDGDKSPSPDARKAVVFAVGWILTVGLLYGISRSIEQWYLLMPVVGLSLFLGAGTELLLWHWRKAEMLRRLWSGLIGLSLCAFVFFQVRYSPVYHAYPEWELASEASGEFLTELGQRIENTAPGNHVKAPPLPMWYPPVEEGPGIRGAAILEVYSVQAWAELRFPERKLRVMNRPPTTPLQPGESAIQLMRPKRF